MMTFLKVYGFKAIFFQRLEHFFRRLTLWIYLIRSTMAKRITSGSVNWQLLLDVVSPDTKNALVAFKSQYDKHLRDISDLPSELPKVDWSVYKSKIAAPGIVDSFQKSYDGMKIPYPSDQGWIAKVESDGQKRSTEFEKVYQEGLKELAKLKDELKELDKQIPFSKSTLEELFLMRPDLRIDPDKPKLWPQFLEFESNAAKSSDH